MFVREADCLSCLPFLPDLLAILAIKQIDQNHIQTFTFITKQQETGEKYIFL